MKLLFQVLLLTLLTLSAHAKDVSFNGTKPAAIIDVRTSEEFSAGHIDGAINIPVDQIGQGIHSIKGLKKDSPILIYCRSGRRSSMARLTLEQQGYKNILDGGSMENLSKNLKICTARTC
jgi:phage shock protein E